METVNGACAGVAFCATLAGKVKGVCLAIIFVKDDNNDEISSSFLLLN